MKAFSLARISWWPFAAILLTIMGTWQIPTVHFRVGFLVLFESCVILAFASFVAIRVNFWVGMFLVLTVFSTIYPVYGRYSFMTAHCIIVGVLWYSLLVLWFPTLKVSLLLDAMVIIALANVLFLIIQQFNYDPRLLYSRIGEMPPVGLTANRNEVSCLLAICAPACFRSGRRWAIPLVVAGLVMAKSFIGVLAIGCGLVFFMAMQGLYFWAALIPILGITAFVLFVDAPGFTARWELIKVGWTLYWKMKHPLAGAGLGHWAIASGKFIPGLWWKYAHNEMFQGMFEMGLGFIVVFGGYMINVIRRFQRRAALPIMALLIILVTCTGFFTFHIATIAAVSITWLAILEMKLKNVRRVSHGR